MSHFEKLDIPKSILDMPVVKSGAVHNKCGQLVDVNSFKIQNILENRPDNLGLIRQGDEAEPLKITRLNTEELISNYSQNESTMGLNYENALYQKQRVSMRRALSATAGVMSASFATIAVINGDMLTKIPACAQSKSGMNASTSCLSPAYKQVHADINWGLQMSGTGALILGAAAIAFLKMSCPLLTKAKMHFIKAALAQGNAISCYEELNKRGAANQSSLLSQEIA